MRLIIWVMALMAISSPVVAGDWRPVAQGSDMIVGIDYSRIITTGTRKQAWTIKSLRSPDHEGVAYTLSRQDFDCAAETVRRTSLNGYTADGRSIYSIATPTGDEPVIPDTVNERVMRAVCNGERFWDEASETANALHAYIQRIWW